LPRNGREEQKRDNHENNDTVCPTLLLQEALSELVAHVDCFFGGDVLSFNQSLLEHAQVLLPREAQVKQLCLFEGVTALNVVQIEAFVDVQQRCMILMAFG
jgi:hypothetical protein